MHLLKWNQYTHNERRTHTNITYFWDTFRCHGIVLVAHTILVGCATDNNDNNNNKNPMPNAIPYILCFILLFFSRFCPDFVCKVVNFIALASLWKMQKDVRCFIFCVWANFALKEDTRQRRSVLRIFRPTTMRIVGSIKSIFYFYDLNKLHIVYYVDKMH